MTYSKTTRSLKRLGLVSLSTAVALAGCVNEGGEGEGAEEVQQLTHESAHALISERISASSRSLEERLRFLDGDARLFRALNDLLGSDDECYLEFTDEGEEIEVCDTEEDNEEETIRIDFMEDTEQMISDLLAELTPDLQVADATQLTYRLDPRELCETDFEELVIGESEGEDSPAPYPEDEFQPDEPEERAPEEPSEEEASEEEIDQDCLEIMEREAPQIQIVGIGDGLQANLLVNGGQDTLVSARINSTLARVSLNLDTLGRLVGEIEGEDGEDSSIDLNVTGELSLEMDTSAAQIAVFRFNVDRAISISGQIEGLEDLDLNFPAAANVFSFTLNNMETSLAARLDVPTLTQALSTSLTSTYEYNPETDEEELIEEGPVRQILLTLGGLDLGATLQLVEEGISTTLEVGLGDQSTRVDIDGQEIIKVDLNPDHGRLLSFNFDHSSAMDSSLLLAFASELHALQVALNLGRVAELEAPDWVAEELFALAVTSANDELPSLQFDGEQLRVITGRLELSAQQADITHVVEGGQCMMPTEDMSLEPYDEDVPYEEPEEINEESEHPLEGMQVGTCRETEDQ